MADLEAPPVALVFDDDLGAAEALRGKLTQLGYEVQIANDIVEARRFLAQTTVAVIVVELGGTTDTSRHLVEDLASHPDVPPMLVVADDEPAQLTAREFSVACIARSADLDALGAALTLTQSYQLRPLRRDRGISVRRQAVLQAMIDAATPPPGRDRR